MMVGEIILAVSAKDARERERESMCVGGGGGFLELTTEKVSGIHWKMKRGGK